MSRPALVEGTLFAGDYQVGRLLAQGGMGAVYTVVQLSTGRERALKVMHASLVENADLRGRFAQEARIGAKIESSHVVDVQGAGIDESTGLPYLVMEHLEGQDLARAVKEAGALPPPDVATIVKQLGHALSAAHAAGIVHRDLKPENVFLAKERRADTKLSVKVLDFGIAKLLEAGNTNTIAMGSPLWIAPEQTEPGPVGPGADVWSFGLLVYYLLVGVSYWRCVQGASPSVPAILKEVLFGDLEPPSRRARAVGKALPSGFDAWFARAVVRDPQARFRTIDEAVAALLPVLGAPSSYSSASSGPASSPADTSATLTYVAATLGFIVLAASGITALWILRKRPVDKSTVSVTSSTVTASVTATASASVVEPPSAAPSHAPPPDAGKPNAPPVRAPIEGTLPEGAAQSVIGEHSAAVRACYNEAVRRDPKVEGTLVARFVVGTDGGVKTVRDGGSSIQDPVFRSCVFDEIRTWKFPKPTGGDVTVDLPYRFETVKAPH